MKARLLSGCVVFVLVVLTGCGRQQEIGQQNRVQFEITETQSQTADDGKRKTYYARFGTDTGGTAFGIEILLKRFNPDSGYAVTDGALLRVDGPHSRAFLYALATETGATNVSDILSEVSSRERVEFRAIITGTDMSRDSKTGYFQLKPEGGWIATKVFVGEDKSEFFLNLNPEQNEGEIEQVSQTNANSIVREFARIIL